jgi:hypothetical protein
MVLVDSCLLSVFCLCCFLLAVTIGFTWAKIDSWDASEYFYVKADGTTVHTSSVGGD